MKIIINAFEVCMPLLILVVIGVVLKRQDKLNDTTIKQISKLSLTLFLPINVFISIYDGDIKNGISLYYVLTISIIYIINVIINIVIVNAISKNTKEKSAMLQNGVRGNQSLFAAQLAINIAGDSIASLASITASILTPFNNLFSVGEFEYYEPNKTKKEIILNVIKSPLTIATVLGFVIKFIDFQMPTFVHTTLTYLSRCTVAIALIMVGASFTFNINKEKLKYIIYTVLFKTLACPTIGIGLALLFQLDRNQIITIMCMFASPVATAAFPTAVGYDTDMDIINSTLVYSYVFAIFSLPLVISLVQFLGII